MYEIGEQIKYMMPLDADYSYGVILDIERGKALVKLQTYPVGLETYVPFRYMKHINRNGGEQRGRGKSKNRK